MARQKHNLLSLSISLLLLGGAISLLIPSLLTLQTSFVGTYVFANPLKVLPHANLNSWLNLPWHRILKWSQNSLVVCGITTFLAIGISALAGYGFAKFNFYGKNVLFWAFLLAIAVPSLVLFLPRFLVVRDLGLYNTYGAMILPNLLTPAGVFFARQYYAKFSDELIEAAQIDGANTLQIFMRIVLPLSLPLLAILALFSFTTVWGDFMWQFIVIRDSNLYTLMLGIGIFLQGYGIGSEIAEPASGISIAGLQAAVSVLLAIPPLIIFILGQKYFMQGLSFEPPQE